MIRFLTAGESHGPMLVAILEGIPSGLSLKSEDINLELRRRQKGFGRSKRMEIEFDEVRIVSGILQGITTGAPITLIIENKDFQNWKDKIIAPMTIPRPGHADLTGAIKYNYRELRFASERASARETAARVAIGAVCKRLLTEFGIKIGGYVVQIGSIRIPLKEYGEVSTVLYYIACVLFV
ncbi:MAG: hypothetical protein DRJ31_11090 [Candidatus Methanomethylicota archaeon]|uniref:chorismate synthase n=1 Tax=Thermoproteota archaeon TaxID=2056631 RepID=A0A497EJ45_9CREN|nr:MAG: hypothetical protein DRJ31_11090 [Candidatus Verstraetearchaeota archaeon]